MEPVSSLISVWATILGAIYGVLISIYLGFYGLIIREKHLLNNSQEEIYKILSKIENRLFCSSGKNTKPQIEDLELQSVLRQRLYNLTNRKQKQEYSYFTNEKINTSEELEYSKSFSDFIEELKLIDIIKKQMVNEFEPEEDNIVLINSANDIKSIDDYLDLYRDITSTENLNVDPNDSYIVNLFNPDRINILEKHYDEKLKYSFSLCRYKRILHEFKLINIFGLICVIVTFLSATLNYFELSIIAFFTVVFSFVLFLIIVTYILIKDSTVISRLEYFLKKKRNKNKIEKLLLYSFPIRFGNQRRSDNNRCKLQLIIQIIILFDIILTIFIIVLYYNMLLN